MPLRRDGTSTTAPEALISTILPTSTLNFQAFAARTWDSQVENADDARFVSMNYRGVKYWARLKFLDVEEQFDPAVGFINRRSGLEGFRRYDLYARYRPRPKFANIRYMSIGPEAQIFTDRDNKVKYWTVELSTFAIFNTGDYWRFELKRTRDVVDEEFSPSARHEDVTIPPIPTPSRHLPRARVPADPENCAPASPLKLAHTTREDATRFARKALFAPLVNCLMNWNIRATGSDFRRVILTSTHSAIACSTPFPQTFLSNSLCSGTTTKNLQARIFSSTTGIAPAATSFSSSTAPMAPNRP